VSPEEIERLKALAEKATPGPWRWILSAKSKDVRLESGGTPGHELVMDFTRWGISGAAPRFSNGGLMAHAQKWAQNVPGREHHSHWYQTVAHPDAAFIAAAREAVPALIADLERARELLERTLSQLCDSGHLTDEIEAFLAQEPRKEPT
jgi:hypothetical protein